jgi:ketosteroid isomerase-like protein
MNSASATFNPVRLSAPDLAVKRRALFLGIAFLLLPSCRTASTEMHESLDKTELEALDKTWYKAWFDRDAARVERMMGPDYVYIAPNGQLLDREGTLAIVRSPTYRIYEGSRTVVDVKPVGNDSAAVIYRWQGSGTYEGNTFNDNHFCTMICTRRESGWQIVLEQCASNK